MKRFITIVTISLLTLIVGAFALIPFNDLISDIFGWDGGYDNEMKMFSVLLFIEWPLLLIIGGFLGNRIFKKYLTNASNGQSKAP